MIPVSRLRDPVPLSSMHLLRHAPQRSGSPMKRRRKKVIINPSPKPSPEHSPDPSRPPPQGGSTSRVPSFTPHTQAPSRLRSHSYSVQRDDLRTNPSYPSYPSHPSSSLKSQVTVSPNYEMNGGGSSGSSSSSSSTNGTEGSDKVINAAMIASIAVKGSTATFQTNFRA